MPAVPPELGEWLKLLLQPAVILVGVGLIVNQQNRRIDDLRSDMGKWIDALRSDLGKMEVKVDRLLEGRLSKLP